jgi:hypothetical protein
MLRVARRRVKRWLPGQKRGEILRFAQNDGGVATAPLVESAWHLGLGRPLSTRCIVNGPEGSAGRAAAATVILSASCIVICPVALASAAFTKTVILSEAKNLSSSRIGQMTMHGLLSSLSTRTCHVEDEERFFASPSRSE